MNILVEIAHPAHVHFFSRAIQRLGKMGHNVSVITRNKDITNRLLDTLHIPYECFSKPAKGKWALMRELTLRWTKTIRLIRKQKIDRAVSSLINAHFPLAGLEKHS